MPDTNPTKIEIQNHPDYHGVAARADYHALTYQGGHEYKSGRDDRGAPILPRMDTETDAQYAVRVSGTPVLERPREFVDQRVAGVFSKPVTRAALQGESPDAMFSAWAADVDRAGTDLDGFMRARLTDALVTGCVYLGIDTPPVESLPATAAAVAADRRRAPWAVWADPRSVVDWDTDAETGQLRRIVLKYVAVEKPSLTTRATERTWYVEWTPEVWRQYDVTKGPSSEVIVQGEDYAHGFGEVPWFKLQPLRHGSYVGRFAELMKTIVNSCSNLTAEERASAFTVWALIGVSAEQASQIKVLPGSGVCVPDSQAKIEPLTGRPEALASIGADLDRWLGEMLRAAASPDRSPSAAPASGISRAYEFRELHALLKTLAEATETAENRLVTLWCKSAGKDPAVLATAQYAREFDVLSDEALFEQDAWLLTTGAPHELKQAVLRDRVQRRFPADTPERAKLLEHVMAWKPNAAAALLARAPEQQQGTPVPMFGRPGAPGGPGNAAPGVQGQVSSAVSRRGFARPR